MRPCVWYDVTEKQPPKSGYYLAFKGMSMGDSETSCEYYYWNSSANEWRDGKYSGSHWANVVYWTDADPNAWYEAPDWQRRRKDKQQVSVAEQDAWRAVQEAIERYEVVRQLAKV
jgi:hypothetical protein